jgi:hypothetical protein
MAVLLLENVQADGSTREQSIKAEMLGISSSGISTGEAVL